MLMKAQLHTAGAAPQIKLDKEARKKVSDALIKYLSDGYVLYMKTLNYHWNVEGPNFIALHEMFEEQYDELHEANDAIAERIRALGFYVPASMGLFSEQAKLADDETVPENSQAMLKNLMNDHEKASRHARECLEVGEEHGDEVTVDMMIARMTFHEKTAWMLRASIG